jgi:hypothetical protein
MSTEGIHVHLTRTEYLAALRERADYHNKRADVNTDKLVEIRAQLVALTEALDTAQIYQSPISASSSYGGHLDPVSSLRALESSCVSRVEFHDKRMRFFELLALHTKEDEIVLKKDDLDALEFLEVEGE